MARWPTNQEVAIDPEMLGKIFEALVLQIEHTTTGSKSLRHDTGSHYTPRPIVHYLCREALAAWLEGQPPSSSPSPPSDGGEGRGEGETPRSAIRNPHSSARIAKLLSLDASDGIGDAERKILAECLTPEEAAQLLDRLFDLRACDPAVGSGAFAMGLLRELVNLARLCEARARGRDPIEGDRAWLYETKKRLIERVIYGVDIQERAVEICKLRLWLSLMVDHDLGVEPADCDARAFRKALKALEPLPNLDFKIRRADSLVDKIHGEPIPLGKLHVGSQGRQALSELTTAKREFYAAERAAEKRRLRLAIYKATADLAQIELTAARNELGLIPDQANAAKVAELDRGQREVGQVLGRIRVVEKLQKAKRISVAGIEQALADIREFFDNPAKPTFVWHLDFAEVFFRTEQPRTNGSGELPLSTADTDQTHRVLDGFDIVLANPPYVRQELLAAYKPWLEAHYATFHGMADLYVYFYELGVRVLKPGGLLSYIVTNKWMKAGYGEPLRRFFSEKTWVRSVVDFGHAKQIFEEADVFPSIIVVQKPTEAPKPKTARLCIIPREQLRIDDLSVQIETAGIDVPFAQLSAEQWLLDDPAEITLIQKLAKVGIPLSDFAGTSPLRGVTTGFNEAFLIDSATRERLVRSDPTCSEIIKPYLRGQDIDRWSAEWAGLWMIFARRGIEISRYPAVKAHLEHYRAALEPKPEGHSSSGWQGRKPGAYQWFEIQDTTEYWKEFDKPKIVYPELRRW